MVFNKCIPRIEVEELQFNSLVLLKAIQVIFVSLRLTVIKIFTGFQFYNVYK